MFLMYVSELMKYSKSYEKVSSNFMNNLEALKLNERR